MKTIEVAAAIIEQDGRILAAQRGYGEQVGGWEFPGGKIEPGETPPEALVREIREELDVEVAVGDLVTIVDHDYETFHLHMYCYLCHISNGQLDLHEHSAVRWLDTEELDDVAWLPADIKVAECVKASGAFTRLG